LAETVIKVLTLMLLAPSLTFGLKVTGSGLGSGGIAGSVEADPAGCEAVPDDGVV
jgi:hypothetical protein